MRRGTGGWVAALGVLIAGGAITLPAAAQPAADQAPATLRLRPGRVSLVYTRGPGAERCDDEGAFREWTAGELGADPFVLKGRALATMIVIARRTEGAFEVELTVEDAAGRVLRQTRAGRKCNDALDRLAIDVVLDLFRAPPPAEDEECDPCAQRTEIEELRRELARERRTSSRERVAREEERQMTEARFAALEAEYRRRMDVTFALSAGAFLTLGLTNNVGGGMLVGGEVHSGILAIGLEARAVFPSAFGPGKFGDDVGDYSRFQGSLVPCARYWYVFGCAVLTVGAEVMQYARDFAPNTFVGPVWEVGPRLGAEIPLGDVLAVRAWGEALFNPAPSVYHWLENGVEISRKQLPVVAGFVGVGLVFHFGKK